MAVLSDTWLFSFLFAAVVFQILRTIKKRTNVSNDTLSPRCQSILQPGPERIHTSAYTQLDPDPSVLTVYDVFNRGRRMSQDQECLGYRPPGCDTYQWISYSEVLSQSHGFGWKVKNTCSDYPHPVGVYSATRPEWTVVSLALCSQSIPILPLYDTFGKDNIVAILRDAKISVVICDTSVKLKRLLAAKKEGASCLKTVILFDYDQQEMSSLNRELRESDITVHDYRTFRDVSDAPQLHLPTPKDVFIICHTSGSTGSPKGAIITHENFVASVKCTVAALYQEGLDTDGEKRLISYLPMAHVYEQLSQGVGFFLGKKVGFYSGQLSQLVNDIQTLKPHWFPAVPRLLNRIYDDVVTKLQDNFWKRVIFWTAVHLKRMQVSMGMGWRNGILDKVVFKQIQEHLGGCLSLCSSGSAPISAEVLNTCRAMLGCHVIEGYGQTESTGAITTTLFNDTTAGHVGALVVNTSVKLIDVPELDYYSSKDMGEVCIKGPTVSPGYYEGGKTVADHIDKDGWLHTGDIGQWLPNGALKIIDRRKHIFKLSQGEFVMPERIENVCLRSHWISQIFIDGRSDQSYLVGIIVPDRTAVVKWAEEMGLIKNEQTDAIETLCRNRNLNTEILENVRRVCKDQGLNSLELIRKLHLTTTPFTIESGLLTPTMKNCRSQLRKHFQHIIKAMYDE